MNVIYNFSDHVGSYAVALTHAVQQNARIARQNWNGKAMFVFLASPFPKEEGRAFQTPYYEMETPLSLEEIEAYEPLSFLVMKTADNKLVPWLCSQTDAIANDWYIVTADFMDGEIDFADDDEDNPNYDASKADSEEDDTDE